MTPSLLTNAGLYRCAFEGMCDPILLLKDGRFVDCNAATLKMLGGIAKPQLVNRTPGDISPAYQPDGRTSAEKAEAMIAIAMRDGFHRFEWMHARADGSEFLVEISLTPISVASEVVLLTLWRDITERKQAESFAAACWNCWLAISRSPLFLKPLCGVWNSSIPQCLAPFCCWGKMESI